MFSTAHTRGLRAEGGAMGQGKTEEWFVLRDKDTGEEIEVSEDDVVRIVGVEIDYVVWAIGEDGTFESGAWRVTAKGENSF